MGLLLLDTSVAVALLLEDHEAHRTCRDAVRGQQLGLAGHALMETMSVLSRLPGAQRRSVGAVFSAIEHSFPNTRFLSAEGTRTAASDLASLGISGGSVYDALVGAAAREHDCELATRDVRAVGVYVAMGVRTRNLM
ncbi:MAG: type II toxin-antitoxin system VapC family toxin [Actinomycetales bacterium]